MKTTFPIHFKEGPTIGLVCGLLAAWIGAFVLIGWAEKSEAMKTVFPGLVTMKANTALGLVLCGVATTLLSRRERERSLGVLAGALAILAAILGFLTLCEYFFESDLKIDELLFTDAHDVVGTSGPGQMAPSTAFCFVLTGTTLAMASQPIFSRWRSPVLAAIGGTIMVIGGAGAIAQLMNGLIHWDIWNFTGMAIHTALGFVSLGVGMFALIQEEQTIQWALDPGATSGFVVAVAVMLAVAGYSWNYTVRLREAGNRVIHSNEELRQIENIRSGVTRMESGQRGFVITGDESLLPPRTKILASIEQDLTALRHLVAEEPFQQKQLDELEQKIAARTEFGDQTIDLRRQEGFAAAQNLVATGAGVELTKEIDALLDTMGENETGRLLTRQQEGNATATSTLLLLPTGIFLSLAILSIALFFLNDGLAEEQLTREKLREAAEKIRELNVGLEQRVADRTAELESANKELEAFSYSVSHDLRAPLRAIDGFSHAVLEDCAACLPEQGRKDLGTIRAAAQRMGHLIDDLLAFSRLGRTQVRKREVDVTRLVESVLDELAPQREGRKIEIMLKMLPACPGDPALLKQVWINLLSNAIKYTSRCPSAVIEIGSRPEGSQTVYFVRDNGAGFDMRYAHKLFGVFQRLHRLDEFEGTGVGLAIVQRIIHRHGGHIWADAKPDFGATFHFTLTGKNNHD